MLFFSNSLKFNNDLLPTSRQINELTQAINELNQQIFKDPKNKRRPPSEYIELYENLTRRLHNLQLIEQESINNRGSTIKSHPITHENQSISSLSSGVYSESLNNTSPSSSHLTLNTNGHSNSNNSILSMTYTSYNSGVNTSNDNTSNKRSHSNDNLLDTIVTNPAITTPSQTTLSTSNLSDTYSTTSTLANNSPNLSIRNIKDVRTTPSISNGTSVAPNMLRIYTANTTKVVSVYLNDFFFH